MYNTVIFSFNHFLKVGQYTMASKGDWVPMYEMGSPMIFESGSWKCEKDGCLLGWYSSMLPELLQECHPFVTAKLVAPPDKIHFEFHFPTMEELHDFVCLHGAGFPACPNDSSLAALTSYIHQVVISKIRIGVPKDKPVHVPCGFSALRSGTQSSCPHNAMTSDPNKCVYVTTKSLDPVWSPRCFRCLGKANHISFDNTFRMPVPSKRGTRHAFIMKLLESALSKALTLIFNPSRGVHAYNMQKGTSKIYLQGHVDQALTECITIEQKRAWMPVNRNASHTRKMDEDCAIEKLEAAFYDVEDQRKPTEIMVITDTAVLESNEQMKALVQEKTQNTGGYKLECKDGKTFVIPIDLWNLSLRIKQAMKLLRKRGCNIDFLARLGTQSDLHHRVTDYIKREGHGPCKHPFFFLV